MRKYYKYTVTAVYLADSPEFQEETVRTFDQEARSGCMVCHSEKVEMVDVSPEEMRQLLLDAGSDCTFFSELGEDDLDD